MSLGVPPENAVAKDLGEERSELRALLLGRDVDPAQAVRERGRVEDVRGGPDHEEDEQVGVEAGREDAGALAGADRVHRPRVRRARVALDEVAEPRPGDGALARDDAEGL